MRASRAPLHRLRRSGAGRQAAQGANCRPGRGSGDKRQHDGAAHQGGAGEKAVEQADARPDRRGTDRRRASPARRGGERGCLRSSPAATAPAGSGRERMGVRFGTCSTHTSTPPRASGSGSRSEDSAARGRRTRSVGSVSPPSKPGFTSSRHRGPSGSTYNSGSTATRANSRRSRATGRRCACTSRPTSGTCR